MKWSSRLLVTASLILLLQLSASYIRAQQAGPQASFPATASRTCFPPSPSQCAQVTLPAVLQAPVEDIPLLEPRETNETEPSTRELNVVALVEEVLARNPSLAQMDAAWKAASARYPQVRSLDDPMFTGVLAPASFGSNTVTPGYRVEISQKIPFCGKLDLRGQNALAEARAAGNDVDDARLQLIEAARLAFFEYFLVERATGVNEENLILLKQFRESAQARYKAGQVPQQDILQAELEIGQTRDRGVTLERMRKVAIARINTLRNIRPDEPLPPAPRILNVMPGLPPVEDLRNLAVAQRPDLKALEERIKAEEATLALMFREFYPDAEVAGAYDTIMGNGMNRDLAPQIGIRLNVPIRCNRRQGAVAEARAKIAQKQAELAARANQVFFQVQEASEQVLESERKLALYDKNILPTAEENVKAARAAYVTGKIPFLTLVEAQRSLVNLRDRYYEANADYFRRLANLERVIGGPLPSPAGPFGNPSEKLGS